MSNKLKKISELTLASTLTGLYTIGCKIVDGVQTSVKVSLEYIQAQYQEMVKATNSANDTANHPTYVGTDNYVYKWNKTTSAYEKTSTYVKGDTGATGAQGATGATGNGISNISKTSTSGLVDTYTVTMTDNTTTTFTVTNGAKGDTGAKGEKGDPFTYSDFTSEQIANLQKPATEAASNLTSFESNITNAENERVIAENVRVESENKRTSSETERANEESKRVTAENSRNAAENARVAAETARESNSATAVTNANNAASNANTAASNFVNSIVQTTGTDTAKVISQKIVTDELAKKVDKVDGKGLSTNDYTNTDKSQVAANKETNSIQDTVVAEALAKLNQEFEALKKIIASGNLGDVHVTSLTSDNVPQYCGQSMILNGSGSPVSNAVVPDFVGQIYIDTTNRNAYMCCDSSSASYWKLIN